MMMTAKHCRCWIGWLDSLCWACELEAEDLAMISKESDAGEANEVGFGIALDSSPTELECFNFESILTDQEPASLH